MRTFALIGLVVLLLAITAVISPAVAASPLIVWFVDAVGSHLKFTRVYNRVFEILLVVALVVTWRRLDLGSLAVVGLRDRRWLQNFGRGVLIGSAGLTIALLLAWMAGGVVPRLRYDTAIKTVSKTVKGLFSAVAVGTFEEVLFRGVLLRRLSLDAGRVAGVALTTAIYAMVHVLRGGDDLAISPTAGIERTLGLFAPVADPALTLTMVGLAGLGLVLAWARLSSGSLWLAIGIHTAWVAVFRVGRGFIHIRDEPSWVVGTGWPPLIGGATGFVAVLITGALLWRLTHRGTRAS